ncbi:hypothetical protein PRUPE_2G234800 [Prunus persica]|uniref:Uncharacterized protein n=1 Tax=Prunus persica TaxID=3760 RepID=A0A251QKJ0_PRUPE|nr:hypothetical protein PRUPE_2G234800 [Prunus persica]
MTGTAEIEGSPASQPMDAFSATTDCPFAFDESICFPILSRKRIKIYYLRNKEHTIK